ncbi:hypothetical protein SAMN05216559_1908 [Halomicrobium zhouii]|uniref:Uncharacterized protein n=1 Tax=Halomicrobium zhouii TaxID=767519 RepID=A0A1I6L2L4_9EURY|nr:hypothetical protein SAMN05216559_1908 [Halomicrobium zhouii]
MGVRERGQGRVELVSERRQPVLALVLAALLVTSAVVAGVPGGALAAGNDATTDGTVTPGSAGNAGPGAGAGNSPTDSVVGSAQPTDPDGDGNYEDVNGDGTFDVVDSQALLAHLSSPAVQRNAASYDFTGDGRTDVSDVQWLYVHAIDPASDDADGDGLSNEAEIELGTNAFAADTDDDGIDDWTETNGGDPVDTDGDGIIDARDDDSDGDRIPDLREGTNDTDGDGTPDYRDPDDDGDGIPTRVEALDGANFTHDVDFDGTVNWRDTDADGDGTPDGVEGTNDTDGDGMPDYLDNDRDNDGLPDHYERNVTGTDPTNNDSDSSEVAYDAADNGVIDGMEDFDNDTLGAYREYTIGTDPFVADTDGDGLSDGFEHRHEAFDPLAADTNDDGVEDGAGDLDDDGLDNAGEDAHGTLVDHNDTDRDGLEDGREVDLGTDPTKADTDDDGLNDAEELALGTDPLDEDTDGDGTLDGEETFETTATENETGATVTMRGSGSLADDVTVEPKPTYFADQSASAGPTVHVVNRTDFENATVTLPVDSAIPDSASENLSVYKWNGSANDTWSPVETTIENGTASATVESFSYFTVLDTEKWTGAVTLDETTRPISLNGTRNVTCSEACDVQNESTLILGGEPTAQKITVEQGDRSFEVVPLSNGERIEEFYDYGNSQINSPLPIFESDKSQLFFWSGPEGLSLVLLHDEPSDGSGGAVTMRFDGLPLGQGSWVTKDDPNDFVSDTHANWHWNVKRTDGGAFRGGLTNESVTIDPAFNDAAEVSPLDPGTLEVWQVLTGRATDPRNVSLDQEEPVTVHVPEAPSSNSSSDTDGDSGSAAFDYDLSDGTDSVVVAYQTEQTNVAPGATVEVTGANGETVSEDLNIGTVGTIQEAVNVSSLADGPATVRVRADGVNLRAELVGQSTFDSDGDGIPDSIEEQTWTMPNGPAETFSTDPHDADTDGDGVPDGEEVQFTRTVEDGELVVEPVVRSNPTKTDTDGDGLTDREEHEGWTIGVAHDRGQAERYASAKADSDRNANAVLTEINVTSNPLVADSDEDGVGDFTEFRDGTNPNDADTDADGIPDGEEYAENLDPAIHDHEAPAVHPYSVEADNFQRTSYTVSLGVSDPSGFTTVAFYKKGKRQTEITAVDTTAETYSGVDITVDRGFFDSIFAGASGLFRPTTVDVETTDVHGNERRQAIKGPDTFGQAARAYDTIPIDAGETGFVGLMSFSSGTTTVLGESIVGIVEMVTNPGKFVDQMVQLGQMILDNPAIITKLPGLMADQIQSQHETRNPFDRGDEQYTTFGGGWSLGYATGTVAPAAASGGGSVVQKGLTKSRKLQRLVDAADSATPSRVPNGVKPHVLREAGKVDDALPDTNVRTGTLSAKLNRMPGPKRTEVTEQFDELDPQTKRYLGETDVDNPASKSADLFRNAGPDGRRALNDLADTDREAADALLEMDDAATQRRFVKAYQHDEVDADELSTALRRYDELDASGKDAADDLLASTGDDGSKLLANADDDTVRILADGSGDVDHSFRRAVARAADSNAIDSYAQLDRAVRRFDDLDGDRADTFRRLAADDTTGDSWLRVAGSSDIDSDSVRRTIDRVEEIEHGSRVERYRKASDVNDRDYDSSTEDPYTEGSIVVEFETTEKMRFARVHGDSNQARSWMFRDRGEIEGLSPAEIKEKYSLPNEPTFVSDVEVPEGTSVRTGDVASNFGGRQGATQFELLDRLDASSFTNPKELPL